LTVVTTTTPRLELDVDLAVGRLHALRAAVPSTAVHYAVTANPHPELLRRLRRAGLEPDLLDLGGGFPARYEQDHPALQGYGEAIEVALQVTFGDDRPKIILEPGRGICGDAGTLVTSVLGVLHRGGRRSVFLDTGVFHGLGRPGTSRSATGSPPRRTAGPTGPAVLAGPTCNGADALDERTPVSLPLALAEGDQVRLHSTGASTSCHSSVGFNGFPPLPTVLVGGPDGTKAPLPSPRLVTSHAG
jgi:ornithine decarboxylase